MSRKLTKIKLRKLILRQRGAEALDNARSLHRLNARHG